MEESTGRREDEPNEGERSEIFNRYALTSRARDPEERILGSMQGNKL